jgi:hypothetical protein
VTTVTATRKILRPDQMSADNAIYVTLLWNEDGSPMPKNLEDSTQVLYQAAPEVF